MLLMMLSTALAARARDDALVDDLVRLVDQAGRDVVICAAGAPAERAAHQATRRGDLHVDVVRVPTAGDALAEVGAVLRERNQPCALRVSPAQDGWTVVAMGSCDAQHRTQLEREAVKVGLLDEAARRARYEAGHIQLVEPAKVDPDAPRWRVEVDHQPLNAHRFALLVDDPEMITRLDWETDLVDRRVRWTRWIGAAGLLASPLPLLFGTHGDANQREDRVWTGVFLAGTGGMVMVAAPTLRRAIKEQQQHPARYYAQDQAEEMVNDYNHGLYRSLDLPTEAPQASIVPEAPSEAAPDLDDLPEQDTGPEADTNPEAEAPAQEQP